MRLRATLIASMVLAVTSLASGGENPPAKINLTEACRLAQLSADGWRDAALFEKLMASSDNKRRSAFYLTCRLGAMPIAPGDGRWAFVAGVRDATVPWGLLAVVRLDRKDAFVKLQKLAKERWLVSVASLGSGDRSARANAIDPFVDALDHGGSVSALVLLLNDPAQGVRSLACYRLLYAPGTDLASPAMRRLVPFLAVRVVRDPIPSVRAAAAHLLGRIVGADIPKDDDFHLTPGGAAFQTVRKWVEENCDLTVLRREEGKKTDLPKGKLEGIDLSEAYYLGRCVRAGWLDDRFFKLLMDGTEDKGRQAHYLLRRLLAHFWREGGPGRQRERWPTRSACLSRVPEEIPALATGPGELFDYAPDDEWEADSDALFEEDLHDETRGLWPLSYRGGNVEELKILARKTEDVFDRLDALGDAAFLAWATVVRSQMTAERQLVAKALQNFPKRAETTDLLIMLLNDPRYNVRFEAAKSLRRMGDKKTIPFLAVRAMYDGESLCRNRAVDTLAGLVGIKLSYQQLADRALVLTWINENCDTSVFKELGLAEETKE
jgi:HEAT repeats